MTRLIDADDIEYHTMAKEDWLGNTIEDSKMVWKADIDSMPTVDAIPVNYIKEVYRRYSYEVADYLCSKCSNDHKENVFEHVFITNIRAKTLYDLLEGYKKETKNEQI